MMKVMDDIAGREEEIIREFAIFDDPMDRYAYLIDVGKKLPDFPEPLRRDEFLVPGCQSKVWLIARLRDGNIDLQADSNTAITRGIIALLLRVLSGQTADRIVRAPLSFIDAIQLRAHLSSQRANGLAAMINRIKILALQLETENGNQLSPGQPVSS